MKSPRNTAPAALLRVQGPPAESAPPEDELDDDFDADLDADAAQRRQFSAQHMAKVAGSEPSAENLAYQVMQAFVER